MKEKFVERSFSAKSIDTVKTVNQILKEYQRQGFRLSLRQVYSQLVARGFIPNNLRSYKNVGSLVSNARQAGLIDWEMIEDRNRSTKALSHWSNPGEIVKAAARSFRIDKWADQPWHIEVMVEKDALSGVLEPICAELDIAITANKGYSSSSTMYEISKRLYWKYREGKQICLIYLGDHDPSGIDMTRDVSERVELYSRLGCIEVIRLALNWDQVELWQPPENPAKETDARYSAYVAQFGGSSWELDAVEPRQLAELVRGAVLERRDEGKWQEAVGIENSWRKDLQGFADRYGGEEEDEEMEEEEDEFPG